jgi:hypothetical protein
MGWHPTNMMTWTTLWSRTATLPVHKPVCCWNGQGRSLLAWRGFGYDPSSLWLHHVGVASTELRKFGVVAWGVLLESHMMEECMYCFLPSNAFSKTFVDFVDLDRDCFC